ncbi:MAG: zinc ribbon domain-containing protein [Chloroflexi bacterium]|nr:zinc ribbon domain-containing protein [Chloroflexota bacterium]MBI3763409.1 zinc ribbon domain-containing protein [Chloroflexota bacterium]
MPLYEFVCDTCEAHFEKNRRFSDAGAPTCPNGHRRARKLVSAPAVVFRGSGWYVTDSRSGKPDKSLKGSSAEADGE